MTPEDQSRQLSKTIRDPGGIEVACRQLGLRPSRLRYQVASAFYGYIEKRRDAAKHAERGEQVNDFDRARDATPVHADYSVRTRCHGTSL